MALALASNAKYAGEVGGLMTFGGFGSWTDIALFSLTGQVDGVKRGTHRDPLNQPAVFINLVEHLEGAPKDTGPICEAWLRYCQETWGNDEHKRTSSRNGVAKAIAEELEPDIRTLFLAGCGVGDVTYELGVKAIRDHYESWSFLRLDDCLGRVVCPVRIMHAKGDDVIPADQAELIASYLPDGADVRVFLTGLYGHTGPETSALDIRRSLVVVREIVTMLSLVRSLAVLAVVQ